MLCQHLSAASKLILAEPISSTLKMEAICSSEKSVETQRTTRRLIPEDDTLHNHRCENLKSYEVIPVPDRKPTPVIPVIQPIASHLSAQLSAKASLNYVLTNQIRCSAWGRFSVSKN
jgi:hypothetical protein